MKKKEEKKKKLHAYPAKILVGSSGLKEVGKKKSGEGGILPAQQKRERDILGF